MVVAVLAATAALTAALALPTVGAASRAPSGSVRAATRCAPVTVGHRRASDIRTNLSCRHARHLLQRWAGAGSLPHDQFGWYCAGQRSVTCGGGNGGNAPYIRFLWLDEGGKPQPPPSKPKPGTTLPTPVNMGSYGTYHFREVLFRKKSGKRRGPNFIDWTPEQMMTQLNRNFSHYFTFTGCGQHLHVGEKCSLDTTLAPDAPVQVIAIAPNGFALKSRGGHPEGAGRTITFRFQRYVNEAEVSTMSLEVEAWGPLGGSSLLGPLNSNTIAKTSWAIFSDNITHRYPDVPPGGFSCSATLPCEA